MKAQRILGIRFPPTPIGQFTQHLECEFVLLVSLFGEKASSALRLVGTYVRRLKNCTQRALGRHGMLVDEVPIRRDDAAEVLRPWTIMRRVDDDTTDAS